MEPWQGQKRRSNPDRTSRRPSKPAARNNSSPIGVDAVTAEIYMRGDPSVKLEALESVVPPKLRSGRFKVTDKLIALLRAAPFMPSKKSSK